jgi:hypothetical protein
LLQRASAGQIIQLQRGWTEILSKLSHEEAQNLNEGLGIIKGIAKGRISTSHILPAGPFARVGKQQYDFVRAAPDEALTSEQDLAIMKQYGGRPANRHDFAKLLDQERQRIISMTAEHRLNFVLLGEKLKTGPTAAGTFAHKSVLCFGWQEIRDNVQDPATDFYEEDPDAAWDSSHLALYVY